MLVDHQSHWIPPVALDRLVGRSAYPRATREGGGYAYEPAPGIRIPLPVQFVDLDSHVEDMNEHGVATMVSSPAGFPGLGDVSGFAVEAARETAHAINRAQADGQERLGDRFIGLAVLPLQDTKAALDTLEEAAGTFGLGGVSVVPTVAGNPIVSPTTMPVFQRIEELGLPIVLHPTMRTAMGAVYARYEGPDADEFRWGYAVETRVNWMFDTTAAALSFVYGGVFELCPSLKVLHPHVGGTLPYLAGRIARHDSGEPTGVNENPARNSKPASDYLRSQFYIDTCTTTPGVFGLALDVYDLDRILYATDYPFNPRARAPEILRAGVSPEAAAQIMERNRLFGSSAA